MPLDPLSFVWGLLVGISCAAFYLQLRARRTRPRAQNGQQGRFRCDVCDITFTDELDAKLHALNHSAITERTWTDIIDGVD